MNITFRSGIQNFALSYAGHPVTPTEQLNGWDQQMEPEIWAPESKFTNSTRCFTLEVK